MNIATPSASDRKTQRPWIAISLVWSLIMVIVTVYWQTVGSKNFSKNTHPITAESFLEKTQNMVNKYTVRMDTTQTIPVVQPPANSDVYLIARQWSWWPILELERGKTYSIHISSMDTIHGFSLQPANINTQALPGFERILTFTPQQTGSYSLTCNEYCGIGHQTMQGEILVK